MNTFTGKLATPVHPIQRAWDPDFLSDPALSGPQGKQPYVDFGGGIYTDMEKYASPEVLKAEWDRLISKVWVICGHLNDIPEEDCFMTTQIGREPFVIVRGKGDEVRAFYNVCQHRGTMLVAEGFGKRKRWGCPYHAWLYNNDGTLNKIPGRETFREETLCHHNLDMTPVHVATFRGFLFITMNPDPVSLDDYLGEQFRSMLEAYDLENFIRLYDIRQVWDVNWKLAMEAFIEGYHVTAVHHQTLTPVLDDYYVQHDTYENGQGRTIFPFCQPAPSYLNGPGADLKGPNEAMMAFLDSAGLTPDEFPTDWRDVKRAVIEGKRRNQEALGFDYSKFSDDQLVDDWNLSFFPFSSFNIHPEGVLFQRWMPDAHDPRKTHYSLQIYAVKGECKIPFYMPISPEADRSGKQVLGITRLPGMGGEACGPVVQEDVAFIERFQQGAESRGFKGAVMGEQEVRLRRFYDEYYKYMTGQK